MKSFNEGNFETLIKEQPLWLIHYWAAWCGPCIDTTHLEKLSGVHVGRVNIEENPELASLHGVLCVPTYIFFKNGQPTKTLVGLQTTEVLSEIASKLSV